MISSIDVVCFLTKIENTSLISKGLCFLGMKNFDCVGVVGVLDKIFCMIFILGIHVSGCS